MRFRAEAFSLTNTPTVLLPGVTNSAFTIGNSDFGKPSGSLTTGRQIQFGLTVII